MKALIILAISLVSLGTYAFEEYNVAGHGEADKAFCSVEPITTTCVGGGEVTAPGCAISCKENQSAKCEQGQTFSHSCGSVPSRCSCF